jgi:hypothetical protein
LPSSSNAAVADVTNHVAVVGEYQIDPAVSSYATGSLTYNAGGFGAFAPLASTVALGKQTAGIGDDPSAAAFFWFDFTTNASTGYTYNSATGAITNGNSPTVTNFSQGTTLVMGGSSADAYNGVDSSYKLFFIYNLSTNTVIPCKYSVIAGVITVTQLPTFTAAVPAGHIPTNGMINPAAHLLFGIGKPSSSTTNGSIAALSYASSGAFTPQQEQIIELGSNSTNSDRPMMFAIVN